MCVRHKGAATFVSAPLRENLCICANDFSVSLNKTTCINVFGSSSSSSSSSSSQKMVIEVSSPQDGMVLGVVLVSFAILDLAAGLLGGLLKLLYH
ncbi:uncharacterized protein LOC135101327 isoform X4 [Scylla paramamosain]|uniref:uncharacterized protein LOC135101327 isoform X4 n=1 Tax=Scylla paramamosain TaxID=85552 RepID=UPI00308322F0